MGSIRNLFRLKNGKMVRPDSPEAKIERGEGRMVDGAYQDYTTAEKQHISSAEANRGSQFQDIATSSALGYVAAQNSLKKKKVASTLLGSGTQVLGG